MARTRHQWPSGPRLPTADDRPMRGVADPAKGEAVPRCRTCGMPDRKGDRLMEFTLVYKGKVAGTWLICERDYNRWNPPPTGVDPLHVQEVA